MAAGTVIGPGTVIRGNLRGNGGIEILGKIEGDVNVEGDVVLGQSSAVKGRVSGVHVTLAGAVQGDVQGSEAVLVERGARVVGDLIAPRIGIAGGALVRGQVRTEGEAGLPPARIGLQGRIHASVVQPRISHTEARPAAARPPVEAAASAASNPAQSAAEKTQRPAERQAPPPVVPVLGKGARARKKNKTRG